MVQRYWRSVHQRATRETAAILGLNSREQVVIKGILAIAILLALAFWGSEDAARDEIVVRLVIGGIVILLFPLIYLYKLVSVPAHKYAEQEHKIADLTDSARRLAVTGHIVDKLGTRRQIMANILVSNPGKQTIKNVIASVHQITPLTGDGSIHEGREIIGVPLILAGPVDMHNPTPYTVDLHPGQEAEFEIADVNIMPANNAFHILRDRKRADPNTGEDWYYSSINAAIRAGSYRVTIVARGEDAPPEYITFVFASTRDAVRVSEERG